MGINGIQKFQKLGAAFLFTPDPRVIATVLTPNPTIDAGTLIERTTKTDNGEEVIYDDRDGVQSPVYVGRNKYEPTYDLKTNNTSAGMWGLYFRSGTPTAFTQSATTITDAPHVAWAGYSLLLVDGTTPVGLRKTMVASITNVKVGATVLVRGVDYDYTPGDLDRGVINILPTSTVITAATACTVTYVLKAVTAGYSIAPLSGPCTIMGMGELHWAACEGETRGREYGYFAIDVPEISLLVDKTATTQLMVRKLKIYGSQTPWGGVQLPIGY